jgi:hypothetical protein
MKEEEELGLREMGKTLMISDQYVWPVALWTPR